MVNSNFLINRLSPFPVSAVNTSDELDHRLGLYRVFLKLYEHHRSLLDEILDLENTDNPYQSRQTWQYIQGVVQADQVYLSTNLMQDKTQIVRQSQGLWVVGRDRKTGIRIQDKRLSRRHAMIQYVANQGFWLSDLHSTNGTYINGESVQRPRLLKDGDCVRLSSLSFLFFVCNRDLTLEELPKETLAHLRHLSNFQANTAAIARNPIHSTPEVAQYENYTAPVVANHSLPESSKETYGFFQSATNQEEPNPSFLPEPSMSQKVEILDRFLNR